MIPTIDNDISALLQIAAEANIQSTDYDKTDDQHDKNKITHI